MMTSFSSRETVGTISIGGRGIVLICASMMEKLLVTLNMRWPVTIWYKDTPTEYRSERSSVGCDCTCSGDA
jgi:hypothetical protein